MKDKSDDILIQQMINGLKHVKVEGEFIGTFIVDNEKGLVMIFKNTNGQSFTFNQMVDEIVTWTSTFPDSEFSYVVATDSQVHKIRRKPIWYTTYITVVWVHRDHKGGRLWILEDRVYERIDMLKRLMKETQMSIDLMTNISESKLKSRLDDFCVHIDVGNEGKSRSVVEACQGWVQGMGYKAEVKPKAVGAYAVADHFSK